MDEAHRSCLYGLEDGLNNLTVGRLDWGAGGKEAVNYI